MREISLDELPDYSPWPRYMLEENGDVIPRKNGHYDERYRRLRRAIASLVPSRPGFEDVRRLELDQSRVRTTSTPTPALPLGEIALSRGERLYVGTLEEAMETSLTTLIRILLPHVLLVGEAVDLGCGYGYQLHRLKQLADDRVVLRGGELSQIAIDLANDLDPDLDVVPFDFYGEDCPPLKRVNRPCVVTTSYTLHQLTSARPAIELLAKHREKIDVVVNLEPEEGHFGDGLLGLLRRRYGEIHGYSADLVRVLSSRDDVKIDVCEPSVVGANALLPATITVWRFV